MSESITFENTFLIDGRGGDPLPDATVVVSEGTIREVRAHGQGARTPSGRVIDLRGKTLMPGLIDAHVHVGNIEVLMERTAALPPAVYVHRATLNLETDLSLGFTTLRDAGGLDWGFRAAIDHGLIRGPRLLLSVNMLTQTGGHGDKPGQWQFTVAELKAAVETAEAGGTYVMAHTYTPRAIRNCLEAGVRSLEHGNLLDLETAQQMAAKGAYLVPTLTVFEILAKEGKEAGMDSFLLSKLDTVRQGTLPALELARRAGVKIGSGTDIIGPFQHLKGRELALKAEVMTPMEAIVSATRTNAELVGLADRLGTVEEGKWADLIVVSGNRLKDLTLFEQGLQKVLLVMKAGQVLKDLL